MRLKIAVSLVRFQLWAPFLCDARQAEKKLLKKDVVVVLVAADDAQMVVRLAGGRKTFHHFGLLGDACNEIGHVVGFVAHQRHMNNRAEAKSCLLGVDDRHVTSDHASLLQHPHPAPASGGGHAGLVRQILIGRRAHLTAGSAAACCPGC
jgi:hypothetical protein